MGIRLSADIYARADALIAFVAKRRGEACTRADVIREAIALGLNALENDKSFLSR